MVEYPTWFSISLKLLIIFKMQFQMIFIFNMLAMKEILCHPCVDHPEFCHSEHFSAELHDFIPDSSTEGNSLRLLDMVFNIFGSLLGQIDVGDKFGMLLTGHVTNIKIWAPTSYISHLHDATNIMSPSWNFS